MGASVLRRLDSRMYGFGAYRKFETFSRIHPYHINVHTNALDSVYTSAHECTQFDACSSMPIDIGLDNTYFGIARLIYEAQMPVRLSSMRADSSTCT